MSDALDLEDEAYAYREQVWRRAAAVTQLQWGDTLTIDMLNAIIVWHLCGGDDDGDEGEESPWV